MRDDAWRYHSQPWPACQALRRGFSRYCADRLHRRGGPGKVAARRHLAASIMSSSAQAHQSDPVLVEVLRGALVESRHRGAAAVVDAAGAVVAGWGDIERPVFGRSAIKPLQALPLVESGAA